MANFKETSNAKKGGLFVGKSHAEGGIPAIVTDTGQPIEVEGGEAIINKKATALHWEELSKINQSTGNGVPIPPPDDADKVFEKYNQGGKITNKEKKIVFDKWKKLVNMTYTELSRYYHSKEGKESGLSEKEANEQGISSGRESAEWILKMKKTNWKKWSDDMWKWANKQISFISRMSGINGDLTDAKGKKTRKYQALLIWGNNPKKKNAYQFNTGGHIAQKTDNNKVRNTKLRFHLGKGKHFMHWQISHTDNKNVYYYIPEYVQIEMLNCKLINSPSTAEKIYVGKTAKTPIAYVQCEKIEVDAIIKPVDPKERLTYNPKTAPNWFDTKGNNIDNFVFEKLVTFGRGVYYEAPDGKIFSLGGVSDDNDIEEMASGKKIEEFPIVELKISANNPSYHKKNFETKAFLDYLNDKIKFSDLETYGDDYRFNWLKVKENSKGFYVDFEYFGGRIYIENYLTLWNQQKNNLKLKKGGQLLKRADGSYSQRGLWDNIRANIGSGKKPTPEMIEQESIIKKKRFHDGGGIDYKGEHQAPSNDNAPLHNLTETYPEDIYSNNAPRYYGDNGGDLRDRESIRIIQQARNKPNKLIKIFRAVPDLNYDINKELKNLTSILNYYNNWNFFPAKNELIYSLQDKYSIDNYSYDQQQELILKELKNQIELKSNQQKKSIGINNNDWVTINREYAKEHGESNLDNKYKIVSKQVKASELFTDGNSIHEFGYSTQSPKFETGGGISEYHLGGDMSKHFAPNGKPSNLTHEQWHLVRTPAFKQWFGFWDLFVSNKAKSYFDPEVRKTAKELKVENKSAISKAVKFLSQQVTENDVLIPMPSRTGKATDTQKLAEQLAITTGAKVFNCLVGKERDSIYEMKQNNQNVSKFDFNFQINCEIPKAENYFIVDNVIGTGVSMRNALEKVMKKVGENVSPLVYAIDLNNISKVIDSNGEPLVVYHGTNAEFTIFDTDEDSQTRKGGTWNAEYPDGYIFMTSNVKSAKNYGKLLIPLFVNMKTPTIKKVRKGESLVLPFDDYGLAYEGDAIVTDGIDYVVGTQDEFIVKLADGTNTKFDQDNPDIRFETGGAVQKTSPNIYENNLLQIRVIGGDYAYYTKVNQEWKLLSENIFLKLKEGAKHELEHIGTIQAFKRKDIPNEIVATFIAYDHLNEDINYYKKLDKLIPENMENGKKIETNPIVYQETIDYKNNLFDLKIQSVKFEDGNTAYAGDVYWKEILIAGFPAIPERTLADLKDKMNKVVRETEINANSYSKNIVFINRKSYRVSDDTYYSTLKKIPKATLSKDSLRYFLENQQSAGMLASGTDLSKYDDLDALRSIMLKILREEEGTKNEYTIPYNFDELNSLKEQALIEFNNAKKSSHSKPLPKTSTEKPTETPTEQQIETPTEQQIETPMENTNTKLMEKPTETPTGSVTKWNEAPVRWKNVKAVRPVTFSINPYDKGLLSIVSAFTGDDTMRPIMSAIHFEDKGLVCTDAHKLLHIHFKHSDFKGNYPSLDSAKAYGKNTSKEEIEKQLNEQKFPNWEAVIPKESTFTYEVDTMKLYQYCKVAINYANKTTNQIAFKFDKANRIGFNGKFLISSLETMMKIQKCPKLYIHLTEPSRSAILSFEKSISVTGSTYTLLMPVMLNRGAEKGDLDERGRELKIQQVYGAMDIDYNKSISCYFDFSDNQIHNADGTIADYKESYGDANEMPLSVVTMLDKFIKIGKTRLPILENVIVDGNGIRVDSLNARIEIANDWNLPQGLYIIQNNAFISNTLNANFDDYPKLNNRVSLKEPLFTMDSDAFKFYIDKAFINVGTDDLRPVMSGFSFECDGSNLSLVSTNGITLLHANLTKYTTNRNSNFNIIAGEVKQLMNFAKNIDSKEISFYADGRSFRIDAGRLHFEGLLVDGKYPNWKAIIPDRFYNQLTFNIKDLYVCMNNEAYKLFVKSEGLKADDLGISNQGNKIFLSNKPNQSRGEEFISKEICEMKIEHISIDPPKATNPLQSFILLMPLQYTNGNYLNWAVEPLNKVISTIGKDKVVVEYTDLNRAYLFHSDNLNFNTSDVYKPVKPEAKILPKTKIPPIKTLERTPLVPKVKPTQSQFSNEKLLELWQKEIDTNGHLNTDKKKALFEMLKMRGVPIPPFKKSNEDAELKDAIRGLEAFIKTSNMSAKNPAKLQVEQAIKGLKALLK